MILSLYDSATKEKRAFTPLDPNNIRMYVCGPTVYDHAHIGNARPVVVFDLLFRILRDLYGADKVTYARNITDVDDKILIRAQERNIDIATLTQETTAYFHQDTDALGVLRPTHEPRATEYIPNMIQMIEALINKEYAYHEQGHVLFSVDKMADYGELSKRSLDDMMAGARVEVAPYKKNPMDFVLWKPSDSTDMGWDSPWGYGRPGWHIECSAMSKALLGKTFDIHGGGIDLLFPHHENERAQSCCANDADYVNFWMHNGFLQINGQKMSKSLGNFFTIRELLQERNISGDVIKLIFYKTHYRSPLNWTDDSVTECQALLDKWFAIAKDCADAAPSIPESMKETLYDDMNIAGAIRDMHHLPADELAGFLNFLGFKGKEKQLSESEILTFIERRNQARKDKDYALSDYIRDQLDAKNVIIKDTRNGTEWFYK